MSCGLALFTPNQTCSGLSTPFALGINPAEGACIKIDNTKYASILIPGQQQCRCVDSTKTSYIVLYSDGACQDDLNRAITPGQAEQCVDVQTTNNSVAKGMRYECFAGPGSSSSGTLSSSAGLSSTPSPSSSTTTNPFVTPPSLTSPAISTPSASSGLSGSDKIAIGVGLGMGLPTIIISVIILIMKIRKGWKDKGEVVRAEM